MQLSISIGNICSQVPLFIWQVLMLVSEELSYNLKNNYISFKGSTFKVNADFFRKMEKNQ